MKINKINRNWEEQSIKDGKILGYLRSILSYEDNMFNFYNDRGKEKKGITNVLLPCAILFFMASLMFPILEGPEDTIKIGKSEIGSYAIGYLFIAISSVLMFIDRFFGHSDSWMRYTLTRMQITKTVSEYHGRWIKLLQSLNLDNLTLENKNDLIDLLHEFDVTLREIVITETETWQGLFSQKISDFHKKVNSKLQETTKDYKVYKKELDKKREQELKKEEERKDLKKIRGSLTVNFIKDENSNVNIEIIGPEKKDFQKLDANKYSVAYLNLILGAYRLHIENINGQSKKIIEKVVMIEGSKPKEVNFNLN
ncbi:SLATT domain-containing protein [Aquimarina sp. AD10]|uniref:SLATT domain-containing protein n=1 Tax=Aquimarina sp. AD10 TaxID=1714849 RepID=UPI000E47B75F|nr:SLATT domain-containing protein [Aquimarina sp. AD10]AXT61116.1 SLATT domain-containing protein [Aquimarina sp. AD10]RKM92171.1 SLATT domain-containing protein [Aquimarina sp. AD10]